MSPPAAAGDMMKLIFGPSWARYVVSGDRGAGGYLSICRICVVVWERERKCATRGNDNLYMADRSTSP